MQTLISNRLQLLGKHSKKINGLLYLEKLRHKVNAFPTLYQESKKQQVNRLKALGSSVVAGEGGGKQPTVFAHIRLIRHDL